MTDVTTAAPAGDPLAALQIQQRAMAQATMPTLKAVVDKAEDIPIGKLGTVLAMLVPLLPEGQVKTALNLMSNQAPALPTLLKQAMAEAEKTVDA